MRAHFDESYLNLHSMLYDWDNMHEYYKGLLNMNPNTKMTNKVSKTMEDDEIEYIFEKLEEKKKYLSLNKFEFY